MCSVHPNLFAIIFGVGGVFVPLTQKSKVLNKSTRKLSSKYQSLYGQYMSILSDQPLNVSFFRIEKATPRDT